MQKPFYVSGFLYNPKTRQILLLQSDSTWVTLGGENKGKEEPEETFARIIKGLLGIDLKPKNILPIYDYFHEVLKKQNFVFYAEVGKNKNVETKNGTLTWVTFQQTPKLSFSGQSKQDVIVGERVIKAKVRDEEAKNVVLGG